MTHTEPALEPPIRVTGEQLKSLYRAVITAIGGSPEEARIFAERFVIADLRGMDWQGLKALDMHILEPFEKGIVRVGQDIAIEHEAASSFVLEANGELGQVVCSQAIELAIAKAQQAGSATFAIRHAGDTGMLASYTLLAIKHDCIGIMFNNTNPYVAPWGGTERVHGIDPLSIAVPAGKEYPILLDMSITPGRASFDLEPIFARPHTAPDVLQFNTLREYALSATLELIAGGLTQMPMGMDKTRRGESAVFGAVIDITHFVAVEAFKTAADAFVRQVKNSTRGDDVDEILLPGERGFKEHRLRAVDGVPVPAVVWAETQRLAEAAGVDWRKAV
jgi:L-2-hydroxycarboxylate dehydrogenase (NAD+)